MKKRTGPAYFERIRAIIRRRLLHLRLAWQARQYRKRPVAPRALPPGREWNPHVGTRAQLRTLRHRWAIVLKFDDDESIATRRRLLSSTSSRPDPKFVAMVLSNAALLAAEQAGTSWADTMKVMLDNYEAAEKKSA